MTCRHPKRARVVICVDVSGNMVWLSEHGSIVPCCIADTVFWCADCGALGTQFNDRSRMRWRKVGCP
jgi:hypothetical protein